MDCFIKKIFVGKIDKEVHEKFVRFGRGSYERRALISLDKTSNKVKVKGSFEYANDFVSLVASLIDVKFSGIILSKERLGIENVKKKGGLYSYEVGVDSGKINELKNRVFYFLLNTETPEIKLKIKKKIPKPGKSGGGKVDDKFCVLEADLKFLSEVKEMFFWDVPDCKKVKAEHTYVVRDLIMPEPQELKIPDGCQNSKRILKGEKDFEMIRLETKRKGRIIRKLNIDGRDKVEEREFVV